MASKAETADLFVQRSRQHVAQLLDAVNALRQDRIHFDALGGRPFVETAFFLSDGTTVRADVDITYQQFTQGLASVQALVALMEANSSAHATNLYRLKS